jgi:hypothetical protein
MKQIEWSRVRLSFIALLTSVAAVNIDGPEADTNRRGFSSGRDVPGYREWMTPTRGLGGRNAGGRGGEERATTAGGYLGATLTM